VLPFVPKNTDHFLIVVDGVSDEQQVNSVHDSNRLPSRLTVYLAVLPR